MRLYIIVLTLFLLPAFLLRTHAETLNKAQTSIFGQILAKPVGTINSTTFPSSKIGYERVDYASNVVNIVATNNSSLTSKISQKVWFWVFIVTAATNLVYFGYLARRKLLSYRP